jgi:hypothetical protein
MTITFKVSPKTGAEIKKAALRNRVSTSKYVRDLVESDLSKQKKKPFRSVYDAMMEIGAVGCIDSGETDRATNPKYMKGFGKWQK